MSRLFKILLLIATIVGFTERSRAFSLLGPVDEWQVSRIGYDLAGDIGGPMNIGEEYRWNTPYVTYGFDESFLNYFGAEGVKAVEEALAIYNNLPAASQMTPDLSEFPFDVRRLNYTASSLQLIDLKSTALGLLIEEMGLAEPERFVWTLRSRTVVGNNTQTNWFVIQRNFDPITFEPTSYINGGSPYIYDDINRQTNPDIDWPNVVNSDQTDPQGALHLSVAGSASTGSGFLAGIHFTGLTYDDVGGLRYLFRTNNVNVENLLADVQEVYTNQLAVTLTTQDLSLLTERSTATTNDPVTLLGFYPTLHITDTNSYLGALVTTNISTYFTNYPSAPQQVIVTNYTTNYVPFFDYTFDNVVIVTNYSQREVTVTTVELVPSSYYSPGSSGITTNILESHTEIQTGTFGEFYIVPTNIVNFSSISNIVTNINYTTNIDFMVSAPVTIRTNNDPFILDTKDLTQFSEDARTNAGPQLLALYPGLLILSSNRYFTTEVSSNLTFFVTNNAPWDPFNNLVVTSSVTYTTNAVTNYTYAFGNVVTNYLNTNGPIIIERSKTIFDPYDPAGSGGTPTVISTEMNSNYINGSFYIVDTNLFGYEILSTLYVDLQLVTNSLSYDTNYFSFTNTDYTAVLRYQTNYHYIVLPISFTDTNDFGTNVLGIRREVVATNRTTTFTYNRVDLRSPTYGVGRRPGVDKIWFVRDNNPSLIANFGTTNNSFKAPMGSGVYTVLTNEYLDYVIPVSTNGSSTNNTFVTQALRRTNLRPDILFIAADLGVTLSGSPVVARRTDTSGWENNTALNSQATLAGPGVIRPQVQISFSSVGTFTWNFLSGQNLFLGNQNLGSQGAGFSTFAWGSFDCSTNKRIVYPYGVSITNLEQQIFGQ